MNFKKNQKLARFISDLYKRNKTCIIVSDLNIATIYHQFLIDLGLPLYLLPSKEEAKTRKAKMDLEDFLLKNGYGKDIELIAFGGGCISDVVGFVASTYMRGVAFSIIPTTVTCFVDASIGGKTAINTHYGKNTLGSFYDPVDVCNDTVFLDSLEKKDYLHQFSEVVKILLCYTKQEPKMNKESLAFAAKLKKEVVQKDKSDANERNILNFGHTFAHAFELFTNYQVSHGEAVWHGIYFACLLSYTLDILSNGAFTEIKKRLHKFSISLDFSRIDPQRLYQNMLMDKKCRDNEPMFILLEDIGSVYRKNGRVCHRVDRDVIIDSLESLQRENLCMLQ